MLGWIAQAVGWAAVGLAVAWINRARPTAVAGIALFGYSVISSISQLILPFTMKPMLEILLVTVVGTVCAYLWVGGDADKPHRYALQVSLADIALCTGLLLYDGDGHGVRLIYGWGVNITYVALCICIAIPGIRDAYLGWIDGVDRLRSMDPEAVPADMQWALRRLEDQE